HLLAQTMLYLGKGAIAAITAIGYYFLVYLIHVHARGELFNPLKLPLKSVLFVTLMLYFQLRAYGEVIFMFVSSCNYFFTTIYILLVLLPYRFYLAGTLKDHGYLFALVMLLSGVIAGWCNENTGFAICVVIFLLCVLAFFKHDLKLWMVAGLIGMGIGFLLLVLSPGNAARLAMMEASGRFNYTAHLFEGLKIFLLTLLEDLVLLATLVYFLVLTVKNRLHRLYSKEFKGAVFLFLTGFISLFIMIFSPNFPARTTAPFTVFLIASALSLYFILKKNDLKLLSGIKFSILLVVSYMLIVATAYNAVMSVLTAKEDLSLREKIIEEARAEGIDELVLPAMRVAPSRYFFVNDIHVKKDYFANEILMRYYHLKSISRECDYIKPYAHSDLLIFQNYGEKSCAK
ncbi:MAG: DUF6056 family protein, partial [Succinivibrio sp.]